jgi:hypothetical protein
MNGLGSRVRFWVWSSFRHVSLLSAAMMAIFLVAPRLNAQVQTGRISGAITDQTGGIVAGAMVTVTDVARGVSRVLTADGSGLYAAPDLIPGIYTVRGEFKGFKAIERQNIMLDAGGDLKVDLTLQPGEQNQTVTVTEALPLMNTTNAETGGSLENSTLMNIPLNGRNYRWMVAFVPAVTIKPGQGNSSINTNGSGDYPNFMIDGLYNQAIYNKDSGAAGAPSETGDTTLIPLDAVQEVNLVVNPKAEYGWDPGLTMSAALKSGTNDIHGSAFAFGRDTALDARNPFASARAPVSFEQFGATIGGPLKKNKLFYFLAYEGQKLAISSTFSVSTPTDAHFTGSSGCPATQTGQTAFGPGNCSSSIPDAIAALNYLSVPANQPQGFTGTTSLSALSLNLAGCNPNSSNIGSVNPVTVALACTGNQFGAPSLWNNSSSSTNITNVFPNFGGSNNGLAKVDYALSAHHELNGSYYRARFQETAVGNSAVFTEPWWEEVQGVTGQFFRVGEIWTPNSNWLNEARFGSDHTVRPTVRGECATNGDTSDPLGFKSSTGSLGGPNYATQYGLVSGAASCGNPTTTISGFSGQLGFSNDRAEVDYDTQGADNLSYTRGKHQFKVGTDIRAGYFMGNKIQDSETGVITFGSGGIAAFNATPSGSTATALESYLAGVPSSETIRFGSPVRTITDIMGSLFAQDDWRILPRLVVNVGLRWEMYTSGTDANGLLGNLALGSPTGMAQPNKTWPFQSSWDPHLSFAWDITGKGTTVVRAGSYVGHEVPTLQELLGTSGDPILDSEPTGALLYNPGGTTVGSPYQTGTIQGQGSITSIGRSFAPVTTGGVATSNLIFWQSGAQLFTNTAPTCGNGLGSVNDTAAATGPLGANPINPAPCTAGGAFLPKFPMYIGWNINIQHAFTNNLSLDVGYVGSHTSDETATYDINEPTPGVTGATAELLRRPFDANCPAPYGQALNPSQCYPWFGKVLLEAPTGSVNYNGLQMNLTERVTHGLNFSANFTLQRAWGIQVGNGLGGGLALNSLNPKLDTGPISLDVNKHFSMTATYAIPGRKAPGQVLQGWAVNASLDLMSGLPFNAADQSFDTSGTGEKADRWTLFGPATPFDAIAGRAGTMPCFGLSGSKLVTASGSPCITVATGPAATPWSNLPAACISAATAEVSFPLAAGSSTGLPLNQLAAIGCYEVGGSAIVPPAQGTYGTMTWDELRGAGFTQLNTSVTKDWKFRERFTAQFRFEVFNLFNRTQYAGTGVNLGAPSTFGKAAFTPDVGSGAAVTGSGGPRAMQLGLKILF